MRSESRRTITCRRPDGAGPSRVGAAASLKLGRVAVESSSQLDDGCRDFEPAKIGCVERSICAKRPAAWKDKSISHAPSKSKRVTPLARLYHSPPQ